MLKQKLTVADQMDFINLWYVMIVINDVLIILGTISKVTIEFRDFDSDLFTLTGIMLGTGALLVYIGLLRYLGFFGGYNVSAWIFEGHLEHSTIESLTFGFSGAHSYAQEVTSVHHAVPGVHRNPLPWLPHSRLGDHRPVQHKGEHNRQQT